MAGTGPREVLRDERARLRRLEGDLQRAQNALACLERFLAQLGASADPLTFAGLLLNTLSGRLEIGRAAFYRRDQRRAGAFHLYHAVGFAGEGLPGFFEADAAFMRRLRETAGPVVLEDYCRPGREPGGAREAFAAALMAGGLRYVCAAGGREEMQGLILLGSRQEDGSGLAPDEIELLRMTGRILAGVLRSDAPCRAPVAQGQESDDLAGLKQDFIGRTARELGMPLAVLKSSLWSLDTGSAQDVVLVDMARDAALRLQDRVEQIIALNDIGAAGASLKPQRTEFFELVEEVCRGMIPEFEEREVTIEIEDNTGCREALLDRPAMKTALRCILEQALAAVGRGGSIEIELDVDQEGAWLVMPARCRRRRPSGGDGLPPQAPGPATAAAGSNRRRPEGDLAVARLIVTGHGGSLEQGYAEDGESRLTIRLPL